MASAGSHLRSLRERHGVSLDEIAQSTRINRRFLDALEADDFGALPPGPFAKGFIRSYCEAVHASPDEPLELYAAATSAPVPRREAPAPRRPRRSLAPVLISLALLVILGAALAAVTMALRSGRGDGIRTREDAPVSEGPQTRPLESPSPPHGGQSAERPGPQAPENAAPPPAPSRAAPLDGPAGTAMKPPLPAAPDHRLPSAVATGTPYRLVARASDTTWIRVRMGDGRTLEETMYAGDAREWISNRPFELRISNAGGVSLELNGKALPPLGARGVVIMRLVLPEESR